MKGRVVVVTGVGTEIGKTHFAVSLLLRWRERARVVGVKPVETGVPRGAAGEDLQRLDAASTFHVKRSLAQRYAFVRGVSPHLAAHDAGVAIDLRAIVADVEAVRERAEGVLVELPGGLFSPLSTRELNADLACALRPDATLLVAPDRLGVLHDVVAATRAAAPLGLPITGVVLVSPPTADASTGTNAQALGDIGAPPVLATLPRAAVERLAQSDAIEAVLNAALAARRPAPARGPARRRPPPGRTPRRG